MTPLPATLFRSARILTTVAVATALAAACSNATPSPSVTAPPPPTTAATEPGVFPSASTAPPTSGPSVAVSVPPLGAAIYVACDAADAGKSCLAPGRYQLSRNVWPVTVTFDVPLGWFEYEEAPGFDGVLLTGPGPDYGGTGWGVLFATVGDVSRDPCDATKGVIPAAQVGSAQNLAAAMAAWPRFKESARQRITLDGHGGLKVQLTSTNPSSCSSGSLWQTTAGGSRTSTR